jgi:DNA-binding SARP family transcriptional activator
MEIYLFDKFKVKVDGKEVDKSVGRRRSAQQIVKLLAVEPSHQLVREQIIDLFWTEQTFDSALDKLNKDVYIARRELEPQKK